MNREGSSESCNELNSEKKLVYLFKASKETEDKFVSSINDAGFQAISIPVLSFKYININVLSESLQDISKYSAVIFTSIKSVDAVSLAFCHSEDDHHTDLSTIRCYVVGKTTGDAAKKLGFHTRGEECGNAIELLKLVVNDLSECKKEILYPCANIRRDTIPAILKENAMPLKEIIVYETCGNDKLQEIVLENIQNQGLPDFMVFFSPSGVKYTLPLIDEGLIPLHETKVVALGPTTEKEVLRHGFKLYGVADKPDPQSLLKILNREPHS